MPPAPPQLRNCPVRGCRPVPRPDPLHPGYGVGEPAGPCRARPGAGEVRPGGLGAQLPARSGPRPRRDAGGVRASARASRAPLGAHLRGRRPLGWGSGGRGHATRCARSGDHGCFGRRRPVAVPSQCSRSARAVLAQCSRSARAVLRSGCQGSLRLGAPVRARWHAPGGRCGRSGLRRGRQPVDVDGAEIPRVEDSAAPPGDGAGLAGPCRPFSRCAGRFPRPARWPG